MYSKQSGDASGSTREVERRVTVAIGAQPDLHGPEGQREQGESCGRLARSSIGSMDLQLEDECTGQSEA